MRYLTLLSIFACLAHAAVDPLAQSARTKIAMLKQNKAPRGSVVSLSTQEVNAWIRAELGEEPKLGLREPKVTLTPGVIGFEAIADFGKLAGGKDPNGLLARMLSGDRNIKMVVRPESAAGKLTVHLERAEIGGVALSGTVLNLVAKLVLSLLYSDVEVDQPFKIGHNVDHATVDASGIKIFIAGAPPPPAKVPGR